MSKKRAAEAFMVKLGTGLFAPADEDSGDVLRIIPIGTVVKMVFSLPRNYRFHKKAMALMKYGFEQWNPPELMWRGEKAIKSFDEFRANVLIMAGHRSVVVTLSGETRVRAKSIAFSAMNEAEFSDLYQRILDVIWARVLSATHTEADRDRVLANLMEYAQ